MKKVVSFVLALVLMLSVFPMVSITAQGEAIGEIKGATLNIGSSLTLDYYATFENVEAENVTMRFTSAEGKITQVQGIYDSVAEAYKFSYMGINPQCMADTIKAELICDGKVLATKEDYCVKAYCDSQITAGDLEYTKQQLKAFKTLIADMLVYGGAAQEYKGYNTENLANASEWIKDFASKFAEPVGVKKVTGNEDENNRVKSVGLNMANVIKIYFKFFAEKDSTVKLNGEIVDISTLKTDNGAYVLYTEDIKATGFDDVYTLTIENDNGTLSTVDYNVNAYIATMHDEPEIANITEALYNYGASAEIFIRAMEAQTEGGEFDLGEEDMLDTDLIILPENASTYETAVNFADTGWSASLGGITTSELVEDEFGKCVHFVRDTSGNWYSPTFHIENYITQAGYYTISFNYKVKGANEGTSPFRVILRTAGDTSFTKYTDGNYGVLKKKDDVKAAVNNQWETMSVSFSVEEADLNNKAATTPWRFCVDLIQDNAVTDIYIDNFVITGTVYDFEAQANVINTAETWVSNELVLISDKNYDDPFNAVDVYLILTHEDGTEIEVPGFWDGGNIWRVRFACPKEGQWTYRTECTDATNAGLHNVTNTLTCTEYSGDLDIYKHGFIKTESNTRYFKYADGTPFFYLGDTHWGLGNETIDMVKTITEHRVNQGYTVWQSEPIGAKFTYNDDINSADILFMQEYDEKFKIIADAGLVHTNSQFFFASEITDTIYKHGGFDKTKPYETTLTENGTTYTFYDLSNSAKAYLEKICRYWVARYSSYPVMWTLGQEVDNDYYWMKEGGHAEWSYVNNPFRYVAQYMYEHDPYKSPLSAHQEGHASTQALNSAFRDVEAHTWYANQWHPVFNDNTSLVLSAAKDYWNNGQGKPVINYEADYCGLWTKDFGARAQGWAAFLSGMFGHGYGAQDTWNYLSTFDENTTTNLRNGVDIITSEEKKAATWRDALEYESSYQLGYMKNFFENTVGDWYNLIPRFKEANFFTSNTTHYYLASNADNSEIVFYFYNFSDKNLADKPNTTIATLTGSLKNLGNNTYNYKWFNPRTGQFEDQGTITTSSSGSVNLPTKKSTGDMVLYLYR